MTVQSELNSQDQQAGARFCLMLRSRDTSSAYRLLTEHSDKLRGFLRDRFGGLLGGDREVEDVVVATIEKALSDADRFRPEREPNGLEGWLFALGVHVAQDEVRVRREHGQAICDPELRPPLVRDERERLEAAVRAAAETQGEPGRTILITDLQERGRGSVAELGSVLDLEPRAVVEHRSLARRVLQPRLQEIAGLGGAGTWENLCTALGYEPHMRPYAPEEIAHEHRLAHPARALPAVRTVHSQTAQPRDTDHPGRWSSAEGADMLRTDPWTHEDVRELKNCLGATDVPTIALVLHRTVPDVQHHIAELARIKRRGPWPQAEIRDFKRLYGTRTDEDLALVFGRDLGAIQEKASQLCIAKDKSFLRKHNGGQRATRMPRWREDELKILRETYSTQSNLAIAKALSRSVKSIVSKAHSLKLKKDPARLREMGRENVSSRYGNVER